MHYFIGLKILKPNFNHQIIFQNSFGPDGIVHEGIFPDDIWVKRGLMAAVLVVTTVISIVGPGAFGKVVLGFLAIVCICTFTVIWSYFGFFTKR